VRAAQIGGRLAAVKTLGRCVPMPSTTAVSTKRRLMALDGSDLYAVVRSRCLQGQAGPELVRVGLTKRVLQVLAPVKAGAVNLAASGPRLALTYINGSQQTRVDVRAARGGRSLFTVISPVDERTAESPVTQIDSAGDVLVTATIPVGPTLSALGWWANARSRVGRPLEGVASIELPQGYPEPTTSSVSYPVSVAAALSDGRLAYTAYVSGTADEEAIEVIDLAANTTRTVVSFPGSAGVLGVDLSGTELAWAEQSLGYDTGMGCAIGDGRALTPVQLTHASITSPEPIIEPGLPVPPSTEPLCPAPAEMSSAR
jgi:hypothetical protein